MIYCFRLQLCYALTCFDISHVILSTVTYAIQLATAYTLLEISPWQPQEVATALNTWKEDQQAKRVVPDSLQQGLNALRSSLLNVGHAQTQHVEKR